jgi:hypothetical protein
MRYGSLQTKDEDKVVSDGRSSFLIEYVAAETLSRGKIYLLYCIIAASYYN